MSPVSPPSMSAIVTLALSLLVLGLVVYLGVVGWLWWRQETLLFSPTVLPASLVLAQAPDIHEVAVEVPGARLCALHLRLPDPKGLVFFLHGNGGSLQDWFVGPDYYRHANFDLFMIDYRGYGKSTGRIQSQAQLQADVRAAWAVVAPRYAGRKIVVYGRSLGTGLAASLAAELSAAGHPPDLTVLASPYSSMAAMAGDHYPWVPQRVLRYPMRTDQLVAGIRGRLLLLHGKRDALIAPRHSDVLQALAPQARVIRISGAAHNDLQDFDAYLNAFAQALADL